MAGTPKDGENLATLQCFIGALEVCFGRMIQSLNLWRFVGADPIIGTWYKRKIIGAASD
jgi:hypothetical protein